MYAHWWGKHMYLMGPAQTLVKDACRKAAARWWTKALRWPELWRQESV